MSRPRLVIIVRDGDSQPARLLSAERPYDLEATRREARRLASVGYIGGSAAVVEWAGEGSQPRTLYRYKRITTTLLAGGAA